MKKKHQQKSILFYSTKRTKIDLSLVLSKWSFSLMLCLWKELIAVLKNNVGHLSWILMQKYGLLGIEAIFRVIVLDVKIVFRISTGTFTLVKNPLVWCFMQSGKDHKDSRKICESFSMKFSFELPSNMLN